MTLKKELELKETFEKCICSNCKNNTCIKKIVTKDIVSKSVKNVYYIKCINYKFK
jgi:hypothetical protein